MPFFSSINPNCVIYGESMRIVNGTEYKMKFLDLGSKSNEIQLFVRSDKVSDDIFMKIIESFE